MYISPFDCIIDLPEGNGKQYQTTNQNDACFQSLILNVFHKSNGQTDFD